MEKITGRKFIAWNDFCITPLGLFSVIVLTYWFYILFSLHNNTIVALAGAVFFSFYAIYLIVGFYKEKYYPKYCGTIRLLNSIREQMEKFITKESTNDKINIDDSLKFLNELYIYCIKFNNNLVLARIQGTINEILIRKNSAFLSSIENLKYDLYNQLEEEIAKITDSISYLLEKAK